MKIAIITFSQRGFSLGENLLNYFTANNITCSLTPCPDQGLAEWTKTHFDHEALIFIGSCGIAVRAIAPFIRSKTSDPAVVVIDEMATYVIALLSGHIGGANELAKNLANYLNAIPVITTATDLCGVFAFDVWAVKAGLRIANPQQIKTVAARMLAGATINIRTDFNIIGHLPAGTALNAAKGEVVITPFNIINRDALHLIPPIVTLGLGCKKNTPAAAIEETFKLILEQANCHPLAINQVGSLDIKAGEAGIIEFCFNYNLPYKTFSAAELQTVPGIFNRSEFVEHITGVDNVCERSALLGSGVGGKLLVEKLANKGVTMALAMAPYKVVFPKGDI